ncbi:HD domain-containing phosphohydrolase [Thiomicrospira microaerophila]|uniref:HD domain-containing phosphohydrolase n=1 Tax=Thiomicrospira microaerophila TaxID=406020 RepID=UPI0005CB7853|nr:HD domain-containing phosphohydrolase [Thiomicrospira microaerophila]
MPFSNQIRFLGAHGSKAGSQATTCIQLSEKTLIDAGNIMASLGEEALAIESIFLTHSHLDHILDIGFFIDHFFAKLSKPLKIYGLPHTLASLQRHILNDDIWPDFSNIKLLDSPHFAINFIPIQLNQAYHPEPNLTLTPIKAHHTVDCCGYLIERNGSALVFSGDTYLNADLWPLLNQRTQIKSLVLDVSFPNRLAAIAKASLHLTPSLLAQELTQLQRDDLHIYVFHLKPAYQDEIKSELLALGLDAQHILEEMDVINVDDGRLAPREADEPFDRIKRLNSIGEALSAEHNIDKLLEMIVTEAKKITFADGGTLYLLKENALHFTVAQTDSLGIAMGGTAAPISWPPLPLYLKDGTQNKMMVAATCALEDRVVNIPDIYQTVDFSFEGAKRFDEANGYRSRSMLVIPLRNHECNVIGVLQLLNKQNPLGTTCGFSIEDESIALSVASQAAVAITNARLIDDLEALLEAFLNSIIYMMGRKSPYTAGHINRMVALSEMIVRAVHKDTGLYRDKSYSPEQAKQIKLSALMHDMGKLATPETVMDKATKLDGHFDRIELIRLRAKHIQAEMEKAALSQKLTDSDQADVIEQTLTAQLAVLEHAMALVEKSNTGGEFLPADQVDAIESLVQHPFVVAGQTMPLITPEEAYALKVQKGTLTAEEREVINQHAEIGLRVLEGLPFPEKYKAIPHIAGAHHEKINGKGYPLGLKGEEISFDARILAVADVFEALTAHDRPYKKPNPLSIAMKILYFMAKDDELDRQLVKFFYDSGLYLDYAKRFLPAALIDEVQVDFSTL